jgi:transposase
MNRRLPDISESAAGLAIQMKKEKRGRIRIRDRIRVLWLLKTGQARNRQEASELTGLHRTTVGKWLRTCNDGGLPALLRLNTIPGNARHISGDVADALKKRLASPDGFNSCIEIQTWLKETFGLDIKYKTVYKTVRYDLDAKLKIPRPSHIKKTKKKSGNSGMNFL